MWAYPRLTQHGLKHTSEKKERKIDKEDKRSLPDSNKQANWRNWRKHWLASLSLVASWLTCTQPELKVNLSSSLQQIKEVYFVETTRSQHECSGKGGRVCVTPAFCTCFHFCFVFFFRRILSQTCLTGLMSVQWCSHALLGWLARRNTSYIYSLMTLAGGIFS